MNNFSNDFKLFLQNRKKSSDNTVQSYLRDLNQFFSYCTAKKISIKSINSSDINRFLEHLSAIGKSEATKTRVIAALRCYYKFLVSEGYVNENPLDKIHTKKLEKKLPNILDAGEIIKLLDSPNGSDLKSIRDKAMLELLYATGIKVSEIIDVKLSDINLQIGILHLHDKKERIIPLYPAAVKTLSNYVLNVRPAIILNQNEDLLFTNMSGQALSRQGLWKIIKHYSEKADIKKDITPHTLRHSFAAHLLENGAQLKDIKEMLGHSDISSTQIYAQFMKSKYTLAYAKYHPLAK
ncbi:MAG: tyrosine recombinase [Acutalibacteraceae bacterium]|nr:tyrosine recombinase [Acutalibacteraceae bacterium]